MSPFDEGVGQKRQTRIGDFFHRFRLFRRKWATPCPHNCHKTPLLCTIATLNEGREHRGIHGHIRAAKESVSMQTLSPTDTHAPTVKPLS